MLPIIGKAKAGAVTRRDIGRIIDRMIGRGVTIGASRTFEIVRKMFNWALEKGLIEQQPMPRHEKAVRHAPARPRAVPEEIRAVWNGSPDARSPGWPRCPQVVSDHRAAPRRGRRHGATSSM